MGAMSESTTIRCGFAGTVWYDPGIGSPSAFVSYWPAGMIQVSSATRTMRMNRIVYADGSAKRDLPVSRRLRRRRSCGPSFKRRGVQRGRRGRRAVASRRLSVGGMCSILNPVKP